MYATEMTAPTELQTEHFQHLLDEGFNLQHINKLIKAGVRSLSQREAHAKGFRVYKDDRWHSSSGLYFPFTESFGQIRCDKPIIRENGKPAKYLTPVKANTQAFIPKGCKVITEGAKDAWSGYFHGDLPTGAVAGVSHITKAVPQQSIKDYFPHGVPVILFDCDGWQNPQVVASLLKAALHLGSKIQLVPRVGKDGQIMLDGHGENKAGLCEYFKAGYTAEDYQELISEALPPNEFIERWADTWGELKPATRGRCVSIAIAYTYQMGRAA